MTRKVGRYREGERGGEREREGALRMLFVVYPEGRPGHEMNIVSQLASRSFDVKE
jgi:hypothetical protein